MEHDSSTKYFAGIGGVIGALFHNAHVLQVQYTYKINWPETFQVCWKAGVGAIVGLAIKALWDKMFKRKRTSED